MKFRTRNRGLFRPPSTTHDGYDAGTAEEGGAGRGWGGGKGLGGAAGGCEANPHLVPGGLRRRVGYRVASHLLCALRVG